MTRLEHPAPADAYELDRRRRAREQLEELADRARQRPLPTKFATEVAPRLGARLDELQRREDLRIADERAGRETKSFGEMNLLEVVVAMASYDSPDDYPPDLEKSVSHFATAPLPTLDESAQQGLAEVISLRQQIAADGGGIWMVERLVELLHHESDTVAVEAGALMLEVGNPPEEMRPTRPLRRKPRRPRN